LRHDDQEHNDCSTLSELYCNGDCVQEQGTAKNNKNNNGLTPAIKCQSVAVAMAGKIRGAINAYLELFVTFWGDAKK
jgi:hypothetical protein